MFFFESKLSYLRWQTKIWLAFVLLFSGIWLWLWLGAEEREVKILKQREKQAQAVKLPTKIDKLNELFVEVAPVKFETITRDLRSYPPEFKDKSYFEKHKKNWAVQVMDVAEHKVIIDYLDTRPDRDKFAYFRYSDKNKEERYVLTYGVLSSFQEAMGATKLVDFRLPNSIRVVPEEMRRYVDMIDRYERRGVVLDGDKGQTREINLSPTQYEIPVAPPAPKENKEKKAKTAEPKKQSNPNTGEQPKPKKEKSPTEQFEEAKARAEAAARAKASETPAGDN